MPPSPTRKVPGKGPDTTAPGPGLQTLQLALQSAAVFDVPTRTRRVILVGGLVGVVLIAVASLISGEAARIKADKIIHFTGYATLAVVLVLGLRPTLYVPGLIALVGLGLGIEYLQPFMGRDLEASDALANSIGVFSGATVGLAGRAVYSYIRRELLLAEVRRKTTTWRPGETILAQGDMSQHFYVIKSGLVRLTRTVDGKSSDLATVGPGDVIGILAAIERRPLYVSAIATTWAQVFAMEASDLVGESEENDRPAVIVIRALAKYLRDTGEQLEAARAEVGIGDSDETPGFG